MQQVLVEDWGLLSFEEAWAQQTRVHRRLVDAKLAQRNDPSQTYLPLHRLILVEHPPVYTLGKSGNPAHLLLTEAECSARGIDYFPINRGGDITFHGPGQVVVYPILDLDFFFNDVHRYVRNLEEVVIRTLADFGLQGLRVPGYTGVWHASSENRRSKIAKLCAIGVHLSRWVTMHGLALNVHTELQYFDYIVPCGIQDEDKRVGSMAQELGADNVDMDAVKRAIVRHFSQIFDCFVELPVEKNVLQ